MICHLISQDHMIKRSDNFEWKPLKVSPNDAKFGCHGCHQTLWYIFNCHVISQDHVTQEPDNFTDGDPIR